MNRRILFLDVDGVLCFSMPQHISQSHIGRLAGCLARVPGVEIVLSSCWRYLDSEGLLDKQLALHGLKVSDITPRSKVGSSHGRTIEILTWLGDQQYKSRDGIDAWVVVDDDIIYLPEKHYVHSVWVPREAADARINNDLALLNKQGLTSAKCDEIVRKFEEQLGER